MIDSKFYENFMPPPEAPTFTPTDEEFKDPLAYLAKIKPVAEKYGVVKVKPPASWTPPFAINIKNFRFTPRLQKLNELEALSRIRLNFLDSIAKFWHMQGSELKIPNVDGKAVDLYHLRKTVKEYGGFQVCSVQRRWAEVAKRLGTKPIRGPVFRDHYEKILLPFDLHESGAATDPDLLKALALMSPTKMKSNSSSAPLRMRSRMTHCDKELDALRKELAASGGKISRELKNLNYGAENNDKKETKQEEKEDFKQEQEQSLLPASELKSEPSEENVKSENSSQVKQEDPIDFVYCKVCNLGDEEDRLLLCDTCDQSFHTFCLLPPLDKVPAGEWRCPKCITEEVNKPREAYGFAQAERTYTLHSFGEMADKFKTDYFGMPCHLVPACSVEKEFWRLVNAEGDGLTVEYGADLLTDDVGSGFPKQTDKNLDEESKLYAASPWNLNNLPVLRNSVLSHISVDISGMKVPWVYVGMCFSTFCWHTEDHWSYSINYLHWGEPKVWYGVSGLEAEQFETVMKEIAPELFQSQPDLLHHLVTMTNPRLLMDKGVRIHTVSQSAGEFVITFPRAYHAGFNQGYNFAEAVNFCPPDWLALGRSCMDHYGSLNRMCVFSHDELVCKIASAPELLEIEVALATRDDLRRMVDGELDLRKNARAVGVVDIRCEVFEKIPDDERQCLLCRTTCFLSDLKCPCSQDRLVCLKHVKALCSTCSHDKFCLRIRFTDDELMSMLNSLNVRMESFDSWCKQVSSALSSSKDERLELSELKRLMEEAKNDRYPQTDLFKLLTNAIKQGEKCANVADQLVAQKIETRSRQSGLGNFSRKLRLEEVESFVKNLDSLPCRISQAEAIASFIMKVQAFKIECAELLSDVGEVSKYDEVGETKLTNLFERALSFDLQLPEIPKIKMALTSMNDLKKAAQIAESENQANVDNQSIEQAAGKRKRVSTATGDEGLRAPKSRTKAEDAFCSAACCLSPKNNQLNWIMCEGGCDQWFHFICVDLTAEKVNEMEKFICSTCCDKLTQQASTTQPTVISQSC